MPYTDSTRLFDLTVADLRQIVAQEMRVAFASVIAEKQNPIDSIQIEELSRLIGRSKSSIYKLCSLKRIPHFKCGKELRFDLFEINVWLKSNRRKTSQEVVDEFHSRNRKLGKVS